MYVFLSVSTVSLFVSVFLFLTLSRILSPDKSAPPINNTSLLTDNFYNEA